MKKIKLTPNAETVLKKRYLRNGESIEEMFRRVADHVASVEVPSEQKKISKLFYDEMTSLRFLPNSPTLMNAGTELGQLSACFVLPIDDSLEGIFEAVKHTALIHKSGGGTGFSFSRLRPKDDVVKTTKGVSSGPVSFMSVFDAATETIKQGGMRRGANMGILRVDHPDIMDFIYAKEDKTKLTNFNLSVGITEEFMKSVKENKDFDLLTPRTKEKVASLNARKVFNAIARLAWEGGDPAIIFLDRINRDNPTPKLGEMESTNPCWTGDTLVSTVEGAKSFKELAEIGEIDVYCMDTETKKVCIRTMRNIRKTGENKPIMRITVDKGQGKHEYYTLTPNHNLFVFDKNNQPIKVQAKDLKIGQRLIGHKQKIRGRANDLMVYSNGVYRPVYRLFAEKIFNKYLAANEVVHHKDGNHYNNSYDNLEILTDSEHKSLHMAKYNTANPKVKEANGRWINCSLDDIIERGIYLIQRFGKLTRDIWIKDCDITNLPKRTGIINRFKSFSNFKSICEQRLAYNHKIVNIELDYGTEDVYNGTVDEFHNYFVCDKKAYTDHVVTGFLSANCGEQPLLPYESCNLGSINLAKFVRDNEIDWDSLKQTIFIAVRFLDNVISCNKYPLPQIDEMTKKNRKIGLGVMGFADMLVQLGIPYNSQQAVDTAKEVMWFIQSMGASMSIELGKERGDFPSFEDSVFACNRRFPSMRNATITTVAPTGTISIIADASSGIEPYFALAYYRNVMDGTKLPEINKYLLKELKKRGLDKEHIIKEVTEKGSIKDIKEIPDSLKALFVISNEIDPIWHVKIQAAFQEYTDNAVSKTINLPNSATVEDVANIYMLAYELGCKGITVYRDGSRQDQVLNVNKAKEEEIPVNTDKDRPAVLVGKTIKMQTGCGKMYVTVNQDEKGNVIEVFTNIGKAGGCATSQCEAIGRLITLNLKANHNTTDIIKQLKGISCHMKIGFGDNQVLSCADAVGKAIEKVLGVKEKQTTPTHAGSCPECSGILQQVEGCATCQSCGYSRCS